MRKNKTTLFLLLLFLISFTFGMSGCVGDLGKDSADEVTPHFDEGGYDDLNVNLLDLSSGFLGEHHSSEQGPDFIVSSHNGMYDFPPGMNVGGNKGYCGINIEFVPKVEGDSFNYASLTVAAVRMRYGNTTTLLSPSNYIWSYPYLGIATTAANSLVGYEIDFIGGNGLGLQIQQVVVTSGLCVVENIDLHNPPQAISVADWTDKWNDRFNFN